MSKGACPLGARDLFEERKAALFTDKKTLEERLAALDENGSTGAQKLAEFLERLDSAYSLYQSGTPGERRELVASFTSNWVAEGKDVDFTPPPEEQLVAERVRNLFGGPYRDRPRTARRGRLGGRARKTCLESWICFSLSLPSSSPQD